MSAAPAGPLGPPGEYWRRLRDGELPAQRCAGCDAWRWYPTQTCARCGTRATTWVALEPRGTLASWTVMHEPLMPDFADRVPFTVCIVELCRRPVLRMLGNLVGEPDGLRLGTPMDAVFVPAADGGTLVNWRVADA